MREFVFALEYEPGTNPVADVLAAYPDASIRSLSCHVTKDSLWRVDHAEGADEALEKLEYAYEHADFFADCLVKDDCGADCDVQVIDRSNGALVVYTYWDRTDVCTSVPHVALEELGEGLLFETYREGRRYRWRIVLGNGAPIHDFFDALGDEVGDCTGMEMLRLTELDPDRTAPNVEGTLPDEQREALHAAVDHGYYETPRQIDLSELAEELDIPRSTLSYRLRRAEAELATAFAATDDSLEQLARL
ncbi:helix-turn-helix domain-containing protein [Natronobacterium gregoryi]|uniref:Bacterio-opsin activator HTH domain-containing protein n=2 Tax=Natronobacterium gregoryi TaxID=44930 RepID=L0ACV6_NATGS|nr:helix-turn-helix domain-containing protein [Natronobacterium gregoryi]AFZ71728.1 putative DNA binding protein [Natronobacterium gregoryi SP2]ELY66788.1 Bacterio-opsin activator HTH domain-containing protein [Natronobacterium gregoryi SP2]PLK18343.1 transcriptional regulator [Natronobacterium gregoryi SP2]SFI89160.1 HTH DNA binding domain-containing protein [Natronobacterium gregoryi]